MITGYVIGRESLMARLEHITPMLRLALTKAVMGQAVKLQALVIVHKLTGQVLHVRTGTLRRSINMKVENTSASVTGAVGTNIHYGAMWEFGFTRTVGAGARGGPQSLISKVKANFTAGTAHALAHYYSQHPPGVKTYAARSFLRTALAERTPAIREALTTAVKLSVRDS